MERNRERTENTEKRIQRIGEGRVAEGTKKTKDKQHTRDRTEGKNQRLYERNKARKIEEENRH